MTEGLCHSTNRRGREFVCFPFVIPANAGIHLYFFHLYFMRMAYDGGMYYCYILASRPHGALYIGVTNSLARRIYEHQNELVDGFTKQYKVCRLVYYESYDAIVDAIQREK